MGRMRTILGFLAALAAWAWLIWGGLFLGFRQGGPGYALVPIGVLLAGCASFQRVWNARRRRGERRWPSFPDVFGLFDRWSLLLWPAACIVSFAFVHFGLPFLSAREWGSGQVVGALLLFSATVPFLGLVFRHRPDVQGETERRQRQRARLEDRLGIPHREP